MTAFVAVAALAALGQGSQNVGDYVQRGLQDATFVAHIKSANRKELAKINKDYGKSYEFEKTVFKLKEPFKLRAEGEINDTTVTYIVNGSSLLIKVPRVGLNQRQDLSKSPGRRQTALDFGVLTPALFDNFFQAQFVRFDRATNDVVFDITYVPRLDDTTRFRVWVDPAKKYITKREWYGQNRSQKATFYYTDPVQTNGVWMPTKLSVRNNDNKVAAETVYDSIKVNTGLSDSLFQTK
jgi:outer membrane lipoprotein-sorting protein